MGSRIHVFLGAVRRCVGTNVSGFKKLLVTGATLVVTSALLVVTKKLLETSALLLVTRCHDFRNVSFQDRFSMLMRFRRASPPNEVSNIRIQVGKSGPRAQQQRHIKLARIRFVRAVFKDIQGLVLQDTGSFEIWSSSRIPKPSTSSWLLRGKRPSHAVQVSIFQEPPPSASAPAPARRWGARREEHKAGLWPWGAGMAND